jgi:dTDP-4-dehydrorhamnose reductase
MVVQTVVIRASGLFAVNTIGVRNLAVAAREVEATLVHFSADYVFDGRQRRPYHEDDRPGPLTPARPQRPSSLAGGPYGLRR